MKPIPHSRLRETLRKLFAITILALSLFAAPVKADELDTAKGRGLVGEKPDGYLGAVMPSTQINKLVDEINAKRRERYEAIAKKNGTQLSAVEAIGGRKAIENTPPGMFILLPNGTWARK